MKGSYSTVWHGVVPKDIPTQDAPPRMPAGACSLSHLSSRLFSSPLPSLLLSTFPSSPLSSPLLSPPLSSPLLSLSTATSHPFDLSLLPPPDPPPPQAWPSAWAYLDQHKIKTSLVSLLLEFKAIHSQTCRRLPDTRPTQDSNQPLPEIPGPLSRELGTYKTVKSRFVPWLSNRSPESYYTSCTWRCR